MIRHNPFGPADDAVLHRRTRLAPRPCHRARRGTEPTGRTRSRLAEIVTRLAARTGRPRGAVAAEWFLRYLEHVVRPVLWLDGAGRRRPGGPPAEHARPARRRRLARAAAATATTRATTSASPGARSSNAGCPASASDSDTFVSDEVTDERFAYYLGINNVLGLIGAFGSQRLADERLLLAAFRRFLADVASGPAGCAPPCPRHLLDSPVLRCKANLLTRLHGLDELVGPVDTQSVYVTIANPLHS